MPANLKSKHSNYIPCIVPREKERGRVGLRGRGEERVSKH